MKVSILSNCASCIVVHNYPSNDTIPSHEDTEVTKRLVEVGHINSIEVIGYLILANDYSLSLKEKG